MLLRGNREPGEVPRLFDVLLQVSAVAAIAATFGARLLRLLAADDDLVRPVASCRHAAGDRRLLLLRGLGA